MVAGTDRYRIGRPIILRAADCYFVRVVHIEMQFVPPILGGGLPLEGNIAGTRDGDSRPRISTVAYLARSDAAVLKPRPRLLASGVDFVEAVLLDPAGIERGVGGDVHGIRQSVARPWSQGPVASVALAHPVQRREFADVQLIALLHIARLDFARALVVQIARDRPRIERRDDEIPDPAAVVFSVHAAILTVHPSQDVVHRILERQRNNRPIGTLAADAAMLHSVHIEHQRVAVSLRRGLPLEGKDAWTGKRRLQPCVLVAFDCARAQRPLAGVGEPFGGAACGTHGGHRAEDRRIGGIALYFRNFRRPPREQMFEVSIARFRQTGMGRQKAVFDACRVGGRAVVVLPCDGVGLERCLRRQRHGVAVVRVFRVEAQEARNLADRSVVAAAHAYDFERIGAFRRDNSLDAVNNRDRPAIAGGSADGRANIIGVVAVRVACVCRDRAAADEDISATAIACSRPDSRRIIAACVGQGFCRDVAAGYGYVAAPAVIVTCADAGTAFAACGDYRAARDDDIAAAAHAVRVYADAGRAATALDRERTGSVNCNRMAYGRRYAGAAVSRRLRMRDRVLRAFGEDDRRVAKCLYDGGVVARARDGRVVERDGRAGGNGDFVVLVHACERVAVAQRERRRGVGAQAGGEECRRNGQHRRPLQPCYYRFHFFYVLSVVPWFYC